MYPRHWAGIGRGDLIGRRRRQAALLPSAAVVALLCACGSSGGDAGGQSPDEEGFREASKQFTTALAEQDAETVCDLFNPVDQDAVARNIGSRDCLTGVETVLSIVPSDTLESWRTVDFSEVIVEVDPDDSEFCFDDPNGVPVSEGRWAGQMQSKVFPCMIHNGEQWVLDADSWSMDFEGKAS